MGKDQLQQQIKQFKKSIAEFERRIEALKEPEQKTGKVLRVEDLKDAQKFYVIYVDDVISLFKETNFYETYIEMGLAFYDEQSAFNKRDAMLLAHECDIACAESWDGEVDEDFYTIDIDSENKVGIFFSSVTSSRFKFATNEDAQAFIDKHGEDKVRNMLLNY